MIGLEATRQDGIEHRHQRDGFARGLELASGLVGHDAAETQAQQMIGTMWLMLPDELDVAPGDPLTGTG